MEERKVIKLKMKTCPKCGLVVFVPEGSDYAICKCNEVIIKNETK